MVARLIITIKNYSRRRLRTEAACLDRLQNRLYRETVYCQTDRVFAKVHGGSESVTGTNNMTHFSQDFVSPSNEPSVYFVSMLGSFLIDYDYSNSLMRALLATSNHTVGVMWFSAFENGGAREGTTLTFEQLGLGATFGSAVQRSINATPPANFNACMTVIGDRTLRF
jgi:hypothetical protein